MCIHAGIFFYSLKEIVFQQNATTKSTHDSEHCGELVSVIRFFCVSCCDKLYNKLNREFFFSVAKCC